jgi:hypothetical protein
MFSIFEDPGLAAAFRRENLNTATSDPSSLKLDVVDWFESRYPPQVNKVQGNRETLTFE